MKTYRLFYSDDVKRKIYEINPYTSNYLTNIRYPR